MRTLLELARIDLSARPPWAPVRRVVLTTEPAAPRPAQLGLFSPPQPAPEKLATTLARLTAQYGPDRVGSPALKDSYLEDQVHMVSFPQDVPGGEARPLPALQALRLLARVLRPPRPAEVLQAGGTPSAVRAEGAVGRILRYSGPYRVRIGLGGPVLRDYYDVEMEDGTLLRVFQDLASASWFIEAFYD